MADTVARNGAAQSAPVMPVRKKDADYVFYELTRSICPLCWLVYWRCSEVAVRPLCWQRR